MKRLVLDAMGVIYPVGDDVADLLCPFIEQKGGRFDRRRIEALYREASLGWMSAAEFWQAVQIDPNLEDEYLRRFQLTAGLVPFLEAAKFQAASLWCLSNDVSEWSRKLRECFGLVQLMDGFVISGDIGARKPDVEIYRRLLKEMKADPREIIFVDDRPKNLDVAAALGMETVLFALNFSADLGKYQVAQNFEELLRFLTSMNADAGGAGVTTNRSVYANTDCGI